MRHLEEVQFLSKCRQKLSLLLKKFEKSSSIKDNFMIPPYEVSFFLSFNIDT